MNLFSNLSTDCKPIGKKRVLKLHKYLQAYSSERTCRHYENPWFLVKNKCAANADISLFARSSGSKADTYDLLYRICGGLVIHYL